MKFNSKIAIFCLVLICAGVLAGHSALADNPTGGLSAITPATHSQGVTLWDLLKAGGLAMVVLGLLSFVAIALIVYDFMTIKIEQLAPQRFTEDLIQRLESRDDKGVRSMCSKKPNIIAAITWEGFERRNKGK